MEVFNSTLTQMLVLFSFIALGYFLSKGNVLPKDAYKVLSKMEATFLLPCLIFVVFTKYCTVQNFIDKSKFFLVGLVVTVLQVVISFIAARFFSKDDYLRKIYSYSIASPNMGFMGNAVVSAVFGEEVLFSYMMFTIPTYIYTYTYGTSSIIPGNKGFSLKKFLNPVFIALALGAFFGLTQIPLPTFFINATNSAKECMSPIAMLLTGLVCANYSLKSLTTNVRVYIVSALRLIVIPVLFTLPMILLKLPSEIILVNVAFVAMPLGLNTVIFPAAYGGDTTTGASMALISHLASVVTIPLMFALFI